MPLMQIEGSNPWADVAEQLTGGARRGISRAKDYAAKLGIEREKNLFKQHEEKKANLENVSGILDKLENLTNESGIGFFGEYNPLGEAAAHRGKYTSLTAGLLPAFKSLFPRGFTEREFKVIQDKYIPKYGERISTQKGKIQGLRTIFSNLQQGKQWNSNLSEEESKSEKIKKSKFNRNNPEHRAKAQQLFDTLDEDEAMKALAREFE